MLWSPELYSLVVFRSLNWEIIFVKYCKHLDVR